jgi:1-acyl-sn-glycerol-3-phosphate acyltransferase
VLASAMTFNKSVCANYLRNFGVKVAESIHLRKGQALTDDEAISRLGLPLFVKPNEGGSSFGATKVKTREQIQPAIRKAFAEDREVLLESYIEGTEVTCGCYKVRGKEVIFPLTEVVTGNDFFDYDAKYNGQVEEITPARLPEVVTQAVKSQTSHIYDLLGATGIIRVDYIISAAGEPYMLEVNTTPGMTPTSFIPQQVKAAGLTMTEVLTEIIENEFISTFDEIRPFSNTEVAGVITRLLDDPDFFRAYRYIEPDLSKETLSATMRQCRTKEEFKHLLCYNAVMAIAHQSTFSLSISGRSRLPENLRPCTFISNHRDIVLDAAFLNVMLYDVGYGMTQVAIGSNLLIWPWIETIVRLNNSFIVKRGLPIRQQLAASKMLSRYIHYSIRVSEESVWIAQREGRCKDSDDRTQPGVLKMLNMGADSDDIVGNMMELNIVPIAISYEIDPCDYLKAQEFQQKRDNPDFAKTIRDDLFHMETGILNNKGRVHITIGSPINKDLEKLDRSMDKTELYAAIASLIDNEIYRHYRFYPRNYVAYDMLNGSNRFAEMYSPQEKHRFQAYLRGQLGKIVIPDKDEPFLRRKILEMYANPLHNHLSLPTYP